MTLRYQVLNSPVEDVVSIFNLKAEVFGQSTETLMKIVPFNAFGSGDSKWRYWICKSGMDVDVSIDSSQLQILVS